MLPFQILTSLNVSSNKVRSFYSLNKTACTFACKCTKMLHLLSLSILAGAWFSDGTAVHYVFLVMCIPKRLVTLLDV